MNELELSVFRNVPFGFGEFRHALNAYSAPKNKVREMVRQGKLIQLKKGYYMLSPNVSGMPVVPELIANHLHSPSYVSLSTALRFYGLIPEKIVAINSITSLRTVQFFNNVGSFYYTHVAKDYYPIGVTIGSIDNTNFLIATPEKALCDLIVTTRNLRLRSLTELRQYLEDDIRLDIDGFKRMNPDIFIECAKVSQKKETIMNLAKLLQNDSLR